MVRAQKLGIKVVSVEGMFLSFGIIFVLLSQMC